MKRLKLFFACMLMAVFGVGNVWGQAADVTYDFTGSGWTVSNGTLSNGTVSFTGAGSANFKMNSGYFMMGKNGAYINFPTYASAVEKIVVTGRSGASASTGQNIYVGDVAVSTATTGATGTNTYNIASGYQAAGTTYTLKVTSNHNTQVTKIEVFFVSETPTCATPTFDPEGGEFSSNSIDVEIATTTDGATIYYTTDGTNPTTSSSVYSSALNITETTTVKAMAVKTGANNSAVASATYTKVAPFDGSILEITKTDFTTVSYDDNAGDHEKDGVTFTTAKVYQSGSSIQFQKTNGLLYNKTDLGEIAKIEITTYTGKANNLVVYAGTSENPSSTTVTGSASGSVTTYTFASGNGYFAIKCNGTGASNVDPIKIYYTGTVTVKQDAGLAYAEADQKNLIKYGAAFTAPTLSTADGFDGTVTYASSDEAVVKVNENTGAITEIVAAGKAVITAHSDETENFKEGSASYTICVTNHAGTEVDPFDVADAKNVIDAFGTKENAYVSGIVSSIYSTSLAADGNISFYISADGNTTGQQLEAYKCKSLNGEAFSALSDVETGATVVITGTLKKYNSTYELDQNCHLVSYEAPAAQKQSIANDQANPYTVAQALVYAADGITYDLDDYVYVRGVVYDVKSFSNGAMNIFIKDANAENQFELYKCAGINDGSATTPFEALTDVQAGDIVIGYGQLTVYNNVSEFKQGNYLVDLDRPVVPVSSVELASTATVKVGSIINLSASVLPANATDKEIVWSVESGNAYINFDNGAVTGVAEGTAVVRATSHADNTKYAECTITIGAADPVYAYYNYEKVTATADIEDGEYLIVYEGEDGAVAFNGGLETLDAVENTIAVTIEDNRIESNATTDAAAFTIDVTNGTLLAASGKYAGVTSYSNGLTSSDDPIAHSSFSIAEGSAVIVVTTTGGDMTLRYNKAGNQLRFRYYKSGQEAIQLYKKVGTNEAPKANPQLAWDPADDIELTVGDAFTAPTLTYAQGFDGVAAVVIASSNTNVATINNGEVELVAEATGTTTITATFAGNDNYKAAEVSYKITVNAASTPAPVLPDAEAMVIVVEYNSKFYAMSTTIKSGTGFEPIGVTKENGKIIVKSEDEAAAIQWQIALGAEAATFQNSDNKYLACSTESNTGLVLNDDASIWNWDATAGCYKQLGRDNKDRTFYYNINNNSPIFRAYTVNGIGAENYSGAPEFITADKIEVQVPAAKADAELAFDPTSVNLILGDDFTAPTLGYAEGFDGQALITYASSKPAVATVDAATGEVTIIAHGTTTITASFEGNDNYEAGEASYTITVNKPVPTPTSTTYTKVTSNNDLTSGEYLIVYETTSVAFDGSLTTLDAEGNSVAVSINEGVIAGNSEIDAATFTLSLANGTLQSASGKYIGVSSNSNGLKQSDDAATYTHAFSIDNSGNAVILANFEGSSMKLRYNPSTSAGNLRFRYYKNDGQQAIQLYKKDGQEPTYETVRNGLTEGWYYTMCLDKAVTAVKAGSIWRVLSKAANDTDVILEEVIGTLDAGRPYIFRAAASTLEVAYTGAAVGAPVNDDDNNGLVGSFDQVKISQSENNYILYNNALYYVNTNNVYVGANRAYLNMLDVPAYNNNNEPQQGAPRRRVTMAVNGPQVATGMESIQPSEVSIQKVMIDGKLYILRGEKMFDATGRLVK